jgi:ppGpp synthetase/RelA/SpoT-type nucleotidyltranferase
MASAFPFDFSIFQVFLQELINLQNDLFCSEKHMIYNFRNKRVCDIKNDCELQDFLYAYREELKNRLSMQHIILLAEKCASLGDMYHRIKELDSLQDKINRYCRSEKLQFGKVSINKCLNDLSGFRLVMPFDFNCREMKEYLESECRRADFQKAKIKITNASKADYKAVHIYFHPDNKVLPWELQIWSRTDMQSNIQSHLVYKQRYTINVKEHFNA